MNEPRGFVTLDAARVARRLWARRRAVLAAHGIVLFVSILVVFALPRRWTSSVTLVPAPREALSLDLTGLGGAALGGALSLTGGPTPQDQLRMVLASRAVADTILTRYGLGRRWGIERREDAREQLAQVTTITTPREGQVQVAVEAESPARARELAAAYASVGAEEAVRLKSSLATQKRAFLERRLVQVERDLALAATRVRLFEERNGAIALPDQTRETVDVVARLEVELGVAEAERAAARRWFTDEAPEVVRASERAAALRRQLARVTGGGAALGVSADRLPALRQQAVALAREQASLAAVGELLRRSYEQARVEEANPVPVFSLLDAAELPERASFPRRGLTVAMATLLTTLGVVAWAAWREAAA